MSSGMVTKQYTEKLKANQIKEYRNEKLSSQHNICPLCNERIEPTEATLDHSYDNGRVRAVLHRSCNGAEGQIKKWAGQRSKGTCEVEFITNLLDYWRTSWESNPLHPSWGKPQTKRRRKRKAGKTAGKRTRKKL